MKVIIIGTGYVGLVSAVGLADLGHTIYGVDTDPKKVETLLRGKEPFYEPGLAKLLKKNIKSDRYIDFYE